MQIKLNFYATGAPDTLASAGKRDKRNRDGEFDAVEKPMTTQEYEPGCFFDEGLYFECLRCGACCTGQPGTIYVSGREIDAICRYLAVSTSRLIQDHLYPFRDSHSIREHADGRCHFYDNGCRIYPVRPHQCRTYPFWFSCLRSQEAWQRTAAQCPGIGQGRFHSKEQILAVVQTTF